MPPEAINGKASIFMINFNHIQRYRYPKSFLALMLTEDQLKSFSKAVFPELFCLTAVLLANVLGLPNGRM